MRRVAALVLVSCALVACGGGDAGDEALRNEVGDLHREVAHLREDVDRLLASTGPTTSEAETDTSSTTMTVAAVQPIDDPDVDGPTFIPSSDAPAFGYGEWFESDDAEILCVVLYPRVIDELPPGETEVLCSRRPPEAVADGYCSAMRDVGEAGTSPSPGETYESLERAQRIAGLSDAADWAAAMLARMDDQADEFESSYVADDAVLAMDYVAFVCGFEWQEDPLVLGD